MTQWTRDRVRELFRLAKEARAHSLGLADRFEANRTHHVQPKPRQRSRPERSQRAEPTADPVIGLGDDARPEIG